MRIEALNVKMLINKRVFYIRNQDPFPPVEESLNDGLLAIGGDLSEERLINAYSNGIFPWYDERSPIMWYSPLERCLFKPDSFKVSHSLRQNCATDNLHLRLIIVLKKLSNYVHPLTEMEIAEHGSLLK